MIANIITGTHPGPRRILLYGTQGIGKSSFGAQTPSPIVIQTEDGLGEIDCHKFPVAKSYEEAIHSLEALYSEPHEYRTVVVDSLDWLERLIWSDVCRVRGVTNIEDVSYGKGYQFALTHWREVLDGLSALRSERGMMVVLIAHAKIERFENPETDAYDRYAPRLHRAAAAMIQEWCDEVLFATYRIHTRTTDEGFNRHRTQAIGTGERVLKTNERPSHVAKNRLGLPDELPLNWTTFAEHVPPVAAQ